MTIIAGEKFKFAYVGWPACVCVQLTTNLATICLQVKHLFRAKEARIAQADSGNKFNPNLSIRKSDVV
jgi:hypothetical protein